MRRTSDVVCINPRCEDVGIFVFTDLKSTPPVLQEMMSPREQTLPRRASSQSTVLDLDCLPQGVDSLFAHFSLFGLHHSSSTC